MRFQTRAGRASAAALVSLALLAAACGGGDNKSSSSTKKQTSSEEETTTTTAVETSSTLATVESTTTTTAAAAPKVAAKAAPKAAPKQAAGIVTVVNTPTTAPAANIKRGGTIVFATQLEASAGFDPTTGTGVAFPQARAIFDVLVDVDLDTGEVLPRLLEAVTSTDAKVWTLKVRQGVKFSDGTAFDANAIKFNWDRLKDPNQKSTLLSSFNTWDSFTVKDANTIEVVLKIPNGRFPASLANYYIGSPKALQEKGDKFATDPVGAGPFIFKSWKRDDSLELDKNPNYWQTGRPYVDHVTVKIIQDIAQRLNSLKAGESNLSVIQDSEVLNNASKEKNLKINYTTSAVGGRSMILNTTKAPFNDIRARRALAYAMNKAGFIKTITKDLEDSTDNIVRQPSPFYAADVKQVTYNKVEAQKLLDSLKADGKKLEFDYKFTQTNTTMAEYFQSQLQGDFPEIKMNLVPIQTTQIGTVTASGDFQGVTGQIFSPDPDVFYGTLHTGEATNYGKYNNPEMDKALENGRSALDLPSRYAAYKKVQELFRDEVPQVVFSQNRAGLVGQSFVQGARGWTVSALPAPAWWDLWIDK
jgi:peptide/nickel transport system substrate-binding protein